MLAERRVELAIVGTHGSRGLERLLLGSVATGVMHRAACNLLVVPPAAGPRQGAVERREDERLGADWEHVPDEIPAAAGQP